MRRKRTKQLIAILLSITLITLATAKPYQEAKATGLEGAAGAAVGLGSLTPHGRMMLIFSMIGLGLAITIVPGHFEDGKNEELKKFYDETGKKMKEDFVNYSTQALNNNVSAAEQERDNAAHARSVIEDWLETASAGIIDTTSEAWDWARSFVSDIRNALGGEDNSTFMNGVAGSVLDGEYTNAVVEDPTQLAIDQGYNYKKTNFTIEFKGLDLSSITSNMCIVAAEVNNIYVNITVGEIVGGKIQRIMKSKLEKIGAKYRIKYNDGAYTDWETFSGSYSFARGMSRYWTTAVNLPLIDATYSAPSGTTDVPGVSNVNDYISIGSDLPYTRPEGAWDICDPNGKKGQVSIGKDIPGKLGYDDWYDVLGGIANGEATWEQVANASDVIRIGSDTDSPYSRENADAWGAYVDGTIIGYDVTAEGDVVITFEDGRVITIPQEYVSGMEWVNEQDKAQDLDKDTTFPVSGTLVYPLPGALEQDPTADPDPGGGGGGDVTVDPDVSDYTLDFRKLFPFCIPFDIYKAVKLLDATPTAPVVHYKFYLSKSKTYTIDLNLNKFNTVAAILRRMECLLFIIGLATATRRIYIRG